MRKVIEDFQNKVDVSELLRRGFFSGVGWVFGATIGFAIVSTILVLVLKQLGGLPLIGGFIASIVSSTLDQLTQNTPILPN